MTINAKTIQYPFSISDLIQNLDYVSGPNPIYIGLAAPGTATSVAGWQIKKITYVAGNVTAIQFAAGANDYDKVWTARAGLAYS